MKCFVIMPFAQDFAPAYEGIKGAVEGAVPAEAVTCFRLDEVKAAGRITDRLISEVSDATVCVADVTGALPNVMWEVGYAMALGKPTLLVSRDRPENLPFDLKDMLTVFYDPTDLDKTLREPLAEAFRQTLGAFGIRTQKRLGHLSSGNEFDFTFALTGSRSAHEKNVRRELDLFLTPYLKRKVRWLVGSWGTTDETVLNFLVEHKQQPIVIGNDEFDVSANALALIEKHDLTFIPASRESIARNIPGGRPRDILFLMKADIVFLFWSGRNNRVKDLMRWYRENGKDYAVGFV